MAKGGYFYDASGVARKLKKGYWYDSTGVARKIKKGYRFDASGVARPCWSGGGVEYYGRITDMTCKRAGSSTFAATAGDYAIFAFETSSTGNIDAYSKSLVHSAPFNMNTTEWHQVAAASVGNYAVFGGGIVTTYYDPDTGDEDWDVTGYVRAYNSSLTFKGGPTIMYGYCISAATVGSIAIFAGGIDSGGSYISSAYSVNSSLTSKVLTGLGARRANIATATVGDYAIFCAGQNGGWLNRVDAYNSSGTRTLSNNQGRSRAYHKGTTVGNHAVFLGGRFSAASDTIPVEAYDASLTLTNLSNLGEGKKKYYHGATTVNGYALFAGGLIYDLNSTSTAAVECYDASLTHTTVNDLCEARSQMAAATVGNYAIFAGGNNGRDNVRTAEAFVAMT